MGVDRCANAPELIIGVLLVKCKQATATAGGRLQWTVDQSTRPTANGSRLTAGQATPRTEACFLELTGKRLFGCKKNVRRASFSYIRIKVFMLRGVYMITARS